MAFINFSSMVLSIAMIGLFTHFGVEGILYKPTSDGVNELRAVRHNPKKAAAKEVHEEVEMGVTADGTTTTTPAPLDAHEFEAPLQNPDQAASLVRSSLSADHHIAAAKHATNSDLMLVQADGFTTTTTPAPEPTSASESSTAPEGGNTTLAARARLARKFQLKRKALEAALQLKQDEQGAPTSNASHVGSTSAGNLLLKDEQGAPISNASHVGSTSPGKLLLKSEQRVPTLNASHVGSTIQVPAFESVPTVPPPGRVAYAKMRAEPESVIEEAARLTLVARNNA